MRLARARALAGAMSAVLVFSLAPSSAPTVMAADDGRMVFTSYRGGGGAADVWTMNGDGTDLQQVTSSPEGEIYARMSPDGRQIAFSRDASAGSGGNLDLWVANADGSLPHLLDDELSWDDYPSWSPDGQRIAFSSNRGAGGDFDVWVMDADGSNPIQLTTSNAWDDYPAWSPDGQKIAFMSNRDDPAGDIYVMDADGTDVVRLTTASGHDFSPDWSPDGQKIAFDSDREGNGNIFVMDADGSGQTAITSDPALDAAPSWSPDGTRVAFHSLRDGNYEIYVTPVSAGAATRITDDPETDTNPDWSAAAPAGANTVNARVSVLPSAACLELSTTSVDFGVLPLGSVNQMASPEVSITNCSGISESVLARGTDAFGTGASWELTDAAASCTDSLGLDAYRLGLDIDTGTNIHLSTDNKTLYSVPSEASMSNAAVIDTACPGSSGGGTTMAMQITFLATE